jgi:hypothetical protein
VTGLVQINQPTSGGNVIKTIGINGATAQLNCGSLTLIESGNDTWISALGFTDGTVTVTGDVTMGATQPQRTIVGFATNGTLNVGGNLSNGTIITTTGISTVNVVGNLNSVIINPGTTATTNISGNMVTPIVTAGAGTLNIAGNMDNPTISPTYTGTVNFNGNGTQTLTGGAIFTNLGMTNAASTLTLAGNVIVTGTLTLTAGKINMGPNLLTLSNTTPANQLSGGSSNSYAYTTSQGGRLLRQNLAAATQYNFPIGTPTEYLPVTVTPTTVSNFAMSVYSPATSDGTVGGGLIFNKAYMVNAMWFIDRSVGTGNSTITIQWADALEGSNFAGLGDNQIGISNYVAGWLPAIATSANAAANTVTETFNTFSPFGVGLLGAVLPVKFGSIKAYEKQNGVQLDWKVYSENKVKNYEVERSADARSYTTVGSLPALYNNTSDGDYGFFDANPLSGISYYRIKNNDMDGKSSYSIVIRVNRNKSIKGLSLYPNPAVNGNVLLQGSDLGRGNYKINIFGANGQEIYKQQIKHNGGTISQTIELPSTISKGIYILSVKDENGNIIFNEKLVKQ